MSDPVTNVEIEDVLSSIRRLVSDGDKARTRDPAPIEPGSEAEGVAAVTPESPTDPKPEKFVLTPAFMIVDNEKPVQEVVENAAEDVPFVHQSEDEVEGLSAEVDADADVDVDVNPTPETEAEEPTLTLGDAVADEAAEDDVTEEASQPDAETTPNDATDRSSLVATIAELEAAVSNGTNDYEPDGSEVAEETIAWPGAMARTFEAADIEDAIEEAPSVEEAPVEEPATAEQAPVEASEQTVEDVAADAVEAEVESPKAEEASVEDTTAAADEAEAELPKADDTSVEEDVYADDDLDGLLDVGGVAIDEEALKDLVADVVRAELSGPLGEKITRNVRKLVRREIYRILSSQDFD